MPARYLGEVIKSRTLEKSHNSLVVFLREADTRRMGQTSLLNYTAFAWPPSFQKSPFQALTRMKTCKIWRRCYKVPEGKLERREMGWDGEDVGR